MKVASLRADLNAWTSELTRAVCRSCEALGWVPAAKGSLCKRLPQSNKEYLGIDVIGFPPANEGGPRWPLPLAAFELENSKNDDRVAYSLWKLLCVRAGLRVLFAYRPDWDLGRKLVAAVCDDVIGGLKPEERAAIDGQVAIVLGSRGEGETFPWGYFKFWVLNHNLGRFEKQ